MTGERGITRFERSDLLKVANSNVDAATARVYDFRDGFGRWEFQGVSQSSGMRRRDGSLAFPSAAGVVIVRARLRQVDVAPPVQIERDVLAERPSPAPSAAPIVLPARHQQLEFHYTATSYAVPERVRSRYQLEGADATGSRPAIAAPRTTRTCAAAAIASG